MINKYNAEKKFAFTLAEVLITIAIIGSVAVITLPNLIKKNQERITVNKLKQSYAIITQAIKMAEIENGPLGSWELAHSSDGATTLFGYLKPYLKIGNDCGLIDTNQQCIVNQKYKHLVGSTFAKNYANDKTYYKFSLNNGVSIILRGTQNKTHITVFFDTNGTKPPNRVGYDFFEFDSVGNTLLPDGMPGTENTSFPNNCTTKATSCNGWGCAYYIIKYGNMNYLHEK